MLGTSMYRQGDQVLYEGHGRPLEDGLLPQQVSVGRLTSSLAASSQSHLHHVPYLEMEVVGGEWWCVGSGG